MSGLRRVSDKRQAQLDSGERRTQGNSTFLRMTAKEFRDGRTLKAKSVHRGLRKRAGGLAQRSEKQKAKEKAWDQFSLFIRIRDANEQGLVQCCTSGRWMPWRKAHAGHFVTRKAEATLFHEQNVHAQSPNQNRFAGGHPVQYERFLDEKYGPGTAERIRQESVKECRRRIEDYEAIEAEYRGKVAQLLIDKPWLHL